jgi:hypothetical protein
MLLQKQKKMSLRFGEVAFGKMTGGANVTTSISKINLSSLQKPVKA